MSDIKSRVSKLIQDRKRLDRLLALEKRRRGMFVNDLVFVGFHDLAQHWWCTQQAVLKSRAEEMKFFAACFADRIVYAHRLGLVDKLPRRDAEVLEVGREITLADVEKLLEREQKDSSRQNRLPASSEVVLAYTETVDPSGKGRRLTNLDLPEGEKRLYEKEAEAQGIQLIDISDENPRAAWPIPSRDPRRKVLSLAVEFSVGEVHCRWRGRWTGQRVRLRIQNYAESAVPPEYEARRVCEFKASCPINQTRE
jgi:hypothetical protein